jgi:predicted component of type VI protein secretion system
MPERERALPAAATPAGAAALPAATALPGATPTGATPAAAAPAASPAAGTTWRILVARRGGAEAPRPFVFRQTRVVLGRSPGCDLPLPDDSRVVSGRHAAITREGGALFVTDLASKNLTYLDGEPLEPERPRALPPGALLEIGDFELRAEVRAELFEEDPAEDGGGTLFDPDYDNPFREAAADLADLLHRIADAYRAEPPGRRDDALAEALEETVADEPDEAARSLLAAWLAAPASHRRRDVKVA